MNFLSLFLYCVIIFLSDRIHNYFRNKRWSKCLKIWREKCGILSKTSWKSFIGSRECLSRCSCTMQKNRILRSKPILTSWRIIKPCKTWKNLRSLSCNLISHLLRKNKLLFSNLYPCKLKESWFKTRKHKLKIRAFKDKSLNYNNSLKVSAWEINNKPSSRKRMIGLKLSLHQLNNKCKSM